MLKYLNYHHKKERKELIHPTMNVNEIDMQGFMDFIDTDLTDLTDLLQNIGEIGGDKELAGFIREGKFKEIVAKLQSGGKEAANQSIDFLCAFMTPLEFAVHRGDWKTVAIFFSFGADPIHNEFDGLLETFGSRAGYEAQNQVAGFDGENPIPGFDGLELLVGENDTSGKAYLWIMKFLLQRKQSPSVQQGFGELLMKIELASEYLDSFTAAECKDLVWTTLRSMRRLWLPHEIAIRIMEKTVVDTLWHVIYKHGVKGIDVEEDSF